MGIFRRKVPGYYIAIHQDNVTKNDWVILLEAGTIVGPSAEKLRVARATLERKVVKKYNVLLRAQHFLVVDGYDPRIHALYFCPQLYKFDSEQAHRPARRGDRQTGRAGARRRRGRETALVRAGG